MARTVIWGAVLSLLLSLPSFPLVAEPRSSSHGSVPVPPSACIDAPGLSKGDRGYNHCMYHEKYQEVFTAGNCSCHTGECRATDWRPDPASPVGVAVKIDGKYCPVKRYIDPRKVRIPAELTTEPAHACVEDNAARGADGCPVEFNCVIINNGG